jgi:hypothetical protein
MNIRERKSDTESESDDEERSEVVGNPLEKLYDQFAKAERREEPVIDRIVNQKILKDEELKQDRDFLKKTWQKTKELLNTIRMLRYDTYSEAEDSLRKKFQAEQSLSRIISLLHGFVENRKGIMVNSSGKSVGRRLSTLTEYLERTEEFYDDTNPDNNSAMLVKRKPRNDQTDIELLNGLMSGYGLLDEKTPKLVAVPKVQKHKSNAKKTASNAQQKSNPRSDKNLRPQPMLLESTARQNGLSSSRDQDAHIEII